MTEQTETQRRIVEAIRKQIHKAPHEAIVEPLAVKFERALEMTSRHCDLHIWVIATMGNPATFVCAWRVCPYWNPMTNWDRWLAWLLFALVAAVVVWLSLSGLRIGEM